jgi:hypothetical protein
LRFNAKGTFGLWFKRLYACAIIICTGGAWTDELQVGGCPEMQSNAARWRSAR